MAVEKLASGRIFVGAPYRRTAAENYVSLFTKSRLEEFERAQKDARDEAEIQKLSYKAQLQAILDKNKADDRYRAKLMDLRTRTENKEFDDATALQKLGAIQGERYAGRVDAQARAATKQVPVVVGSTTSSVSTGGFGGGGGGAPKLPDLSPSSGTQQKLDTIKGQLGSAPSSEAQVQAIVRETGPQGMLTTEDPNDRRKAVGQVIERLAKEEEGKLVAVGIDAAKARSSARAYAKSKALEVNPALGADIDQYYADVDAVAAATAAGGGGGGGTRVSTSDRDVGFYRPRGDLGAANIPGQVDIGQAPSRADVLAAIAAAEGSIPVAGEVPAPPVLDPFTRGRTLYSERFGPSVAPFPFEQRRALDILRGLPPEMQSQIGAAYRDYLAQQEAEARRTPEKEAIVARVTDDAGLLTEPPVVGAAPAAAPPEPVATPVAPAPEAAPTIPPPAPPVEAAPPPEPAEPRILPTAPPAPPAPEPYVEDAETIALRKQAMAAVQAREVAAKRAEIEAALAKRKADRGLVEGMFSGYDAITEPQSGRMKAFMEAVPYMPMTPPPVAGRLTLPQLTPPEQRPAPVPMPQVNTAEARKRALELAALGVKEEGALMATPPAAPGTAMAAPKTAAKLDLKGPGPLAAKSGEAIQAETDAMVLAGSSLVALTKNLVDDEKFRERVLKTKPGQFAAQVYRANREAKKTIGASQNTVIDEYMGNTKDMETALAVVYALGSLTTPPTPEKALTK